MGRYNNRRTQQQAAELRNTPSRARFSKGPPKKTGKKPGRSSDGSAKESVVNKISRRVEEKKLQRTAAPGTRRHALDGIDLSKLDEIALSEQSIQLVTKLLQDLNIITEVSTSDNDEEEGDDAEEPEELEGTGDNEPSMMRSSAGYTEYEDDFETDEDEDIPDLSILDTDGADEGDTRAREDRIDEELLQSPLFQHLTNKLSFTHAQAVRACKGIENWNMKEESKNDSSTSASELLSLAMDWLCLHLSDEELREGFRVNPESIAKQSPSGILLVGSGKTRPIPHSSISIAKPLTSDREWQESIKREERKVGFLRLGFSSLECERASNPSTDNHVKNAEEDEATLRIILALLEAEVLGEGSIRQVQPTEADLELAREELEQEVQALEAIFDNNFQKIDSNDGLQGRFVVVITPAEDLRPPASSTECRLHVFPRKGYPLLEAPLVLLVNPTLPPSLLRRVNSNLVHRAAQLVGEPCIFALVDHLANILPEMQLDFIKEQRTKEMEAEQLKMRIEAGHDVEALIKSQYESDGILGRRQRAKLKSAEKAYDRLEKSHLQEMERRQQQDKRVAQAREQLVSLRSTMAQRAIEDRNRQRIEEEAEKAARFAMNRAFSDGKHVEEARRLAEDARRESMRRNGVEVDISHDTRVREPDETEEKIEGEESLDEVKIEYQATATTSAFMVRLRQYYSKAAMAKTRAEETIENVSASKSEDSLNDFKIILSSPKESCNSISGSVHVPHPVPIPTGDLGYVMNDVMSTQKDQPWLVSPEARVPNSTWREGLPVDLSKRDRISDKLRSELEAKYKDAESAGVILSDTSKSKNGTDAGQFYRMLCQRRRLPAYEMKDEIIKAIQSSQVCVVSGDTGCGKTTQVPQLILDDMIWKGRGAEANIIVTQPRRISAIGVAERVAAERCEGTGEICGYSIRMENKRSKYTRILMCTTGILLRRLQCDPDLASVSHIFLDEIHERTVEGDFLLIILKGLLERRKSLKLILMSATLNAHAFSEYFGGCPIVSIPGRAHPVIEYRLEDVLKLTGYEVQPDSDYALKTSDNNPPRFSKSKLRQMYYPRYPTSVISSLSIVDEAAINYDLLAELLEYITLNTEEGAILVFMPGMGEITKATEELYKKEFFQGSKVAIYPLHSSLSTTDQTAVFDVPPKGVRKIVVSTNIAETSITIEDVVYVVDSGRVKENRKDELNEVPTLVETWVSRASAKQRRGRAGRVRPGIAYHMYSSHTYEHDLQEYQLPEMLRVGLEDLVLQILLLDLGEPTSFLAKALNPPSALAMKNSLKLLEGLGAVEVRWDKASKEMVGEKGSDIVCSAISADIGLTALGFHLATLPVDPRVGKMMIYGALFGCTDAALTIAASMAARSPFLSPFDKREQATEARRTFATEGSDHLTTLSAFQQWKKLRRNKGDRAASAFLRDSFLSRLTLFQMEDLRKQFANLLVEIGFLPKTFRLSDSEQRRMDPANSNESNTALLKAILCAGLYPNIIVAPRDLVGEKPGISEAGECVFHSKKGDVHLHPSTISFTSRHFDSRYCCYHEIVKTSKTYVRDCTTVSPFALLLFGGSLHVYHSHHVVTLDEWLKFRISAKPATLVKHLRSQMESLLLKKIVNPQEDVTGSNEGRALIQAVSTLLENEKPAKLPDGAEIVQPFEMKSRSQPVLSGRGSRGGRGRGRRGGGGAGQKGRGQGSMNNGNRTS